MKLRADRPCAVLLFQNAGMPRWGANCAGFMLTGEAGQGSAVFAAHHQHLRIQISTSHFSFALSPSKFPIPGYLRWP